MFEKLTPRLILAFLIAGLAPLVITTSFVYINFEDEFQESLRNRLTASLEESTRALLDYVIVMAFESKLLATDAHVIDAAITHNGTVSMNIYLQNQVMIYNRTIEGKPKAIMLADLNGLVFASSDPLHLGKNLSIEKYFIDGKKRFATDLGHNNTFSQDEYTPMIATHPIVTIRNQTVGVVVAIYPFEELQSAIYGETYRNILRAGTNNSLVFNNFTQSEEDRVYLLDSNGTMIVPPLLTVEENKIWLKRKIEIFPVKECLENGRSTIGEYISFDGRSVIGGSFCGVTNSVFIAEIDKDLALQPFRQVIYTMFFVGAILAATIITFAYLLSRKIAHPIEQLSDTVERISIGETDVEIDASIKERKDEIGRLANGFDRTLASLKLAMQRNSEKSKGSN